ncbi:MAG: N-acetylmuramic acid 6-phosphate etherase [Candidatus Acetothermia bacterium]|jgi:N-acetylmuramic acid 6-phosphate etherase|nr:N-acetylmuramic acid 6-phosphate etherase [Candidatus Acetothermia bacterium]
MLDLPVTEQPNPVAVGLDTKTTLGILNIMNAEDQKVPLAVASQLETIARLVDAFVRAYEAGGRVFYVGAGTSGRLGVLDAVECMPTFGIPAGRVEAILAGGIGAFFRSWEGLEDDEAAGQAVVIEKEMGREDLVIGITASGETPFVLGCAAAAKKRGCTTGAITCSPASTISRLVDIPVVVVVGPEVVAGSTRLKAGTAQKLVLNMVSTTAAIRLGKVYDRFMVDLQATNRKLRERAARILMAITGEDEAVVEVVLQDANYQVKTALLMLLGRVSCQTARELLQSHGGYVRKALEALGIGGEDAC